MNVKNIVAADISSLEKQLDAYESEGFNPTLAMIFSSVSVDLDKVANCFDKRDIELFGLSTAGEISNTKVLDNSAVGLLFDIDKSDFKIHFLEAGERSTFQVSNDLGNEVKKSFDNPALIVGSGGVAIDAEQIVFGLRASIEREIPIFGGLAADDLTLKGTYAFSRKGVTNNGLVGLVLNNDKVLVKGLAISGWEAVGTENTITKAEGNVVYTINDEPALDVFIKYFGYFDGLDINGAQINTMSAQYPLQIIRDDGTTVLRSPLIGSEEERTLVLAGGVRQGDKFRFSISPGFEVIDQTVNEFGEFKNQVEEADALVLFSCKGRHAALGPLIEDEIEGIYNYWEKPLIGFFTYGEIGASKGGVVDFHNETCSLVLLKEK